MKDVAEMLEELLVLARAGEFSSIAVAGVTPDGCASTTYSWQSGSSSVVELVGTVELLRARIILEQLEIPLSEYSGQMGHEAIKPAQPKPVLVYSDTLTKQKRTQ